MAPKTLIVTTEQKNKKEYKQMLNIVFTQRFNNFSQSSLAQAGDVTKSSMCSKQMQLLRLFH